VAGDMKKIYESSQTSKEGNPKRRWNGPRLHFVPGGKNQQRLSPIHVIVFERKRGHLEKSNGISSTVYRTPSKKRFWNGPAQAILWQKWSEK
jgi:hypothetical protein